MTYSWLEFYSRFAILIGWLILLGGGGATIAAAAQADDGAQALVVLAIGIPVTLLWALVPLIVGQLIDVLLNIASDIAEIADRGQTRDARDS